MLFRQILHEDLGCASYLVGDTGAGRRRGDRPAVGHRALPAAEPPARGADRARARDPQPRRPRLRPRPARRGRPERRSTSTSSPTPSTRTRPFADGWTLRLGDVEIEAMHTPGHRPEHTSFLLRDAERGGDPWAVLTGDSLFVGDVARPDLAVEPREGAAGIFRSLHERLLALPDDVEVWPGHLGGSLCGSSGIDHKTSSTIGFERAPQPRAAASTTRTSSSRTRSRRSATGRPTSSTSSRSTAGRWSRRWAPRAPLAPRAVEVGDRRGRAASSTPAPTSSSTRPTSPARSAPRPTTPASRPRSRKVVPPDVELIVVAASDGYELEAAELLASVGLRVRGFLEGGMTAWRSEERPVRADRADRPRRARRAARAATDLARPRRPRRRRVRRGPHPRLGPHPLRRARRAPRRAAARPGDRRDLQRRQAQRPGRLDPAARGLRARHPRRRRRRRHLAPRPGARSRATESALLLLAPSLVFPALIFCRNGISRLKKAFTFGCAALGSLWA